MRILLFLLTLVLIRVFFFSEKDGFESTYQTINELCIQTLEKTKKSVLKIAVVGNGPISATDIEIIKEFDLILQFNHAKHYDAIGRCDILAIRPLEGGHNNSKLNHSKKMIQRLNSKSHILPVVLTKDRVTIFENLNKNKCNILSPVFIYEEYYKNRLPMDHSLAERTLFDCKEDKCKYKNTPNGPSTGAAVLNELYHLDIIKSIDVFGMNSFGIHAHVDFKYPTITKDYCNKCTFHKTSRDSYD